MRILTEVTYRGATHLVFAPVLATEPPVSALEGWWPAMLGPAFDPTHRVEPLLLDKPLARVAEARDADVRRGVAG